MLRFDLLESWFEANVEIVDVSDFAINDEKKKKKFPYKFSISTCILRYLFHLAEYMQT